MNVMLIFDVVVTLLGVYIFILSFKTKNQGEVPTLFVQAEELAQIKDMASFAAELWLKIMIFGLVCFVFGGISLLIDMGHFDFFGYSNIWNIASIILFLAVWIWFSMQLTKTKTKYMM